MIFFPGLFSRARAGSCKALRTFSPQNKITVKINLQKTLKNAFLLSFCISLSNTKNFHYLPRARLDTSA